MLLRSKVTEKVAICKGGKPRTDGQCSFGEVCLILVSLILADKGSGEKGDKGTARSLRWVGLLRMRMSDL